MWLRALSEIVEVRDLMVILLEIGCGCMRRIADGWCGALTGRHCLLSQFLRHETAKSVSEEDLRLDLEKGVCMIHVEMTLGLVFGIRSDVVVYL